MTDYTFDKNNFDSHHRSRKAIADVHIQIVVLRSTHKMPFMSDPFFPETSSKPQLVFLVLINGSTTTIACVKHHTDVTEIDLITSTDTITFSFLFNIILN